MNGSYILQAGLSWILLFFFVKLPLMLLGLFVIPIALRFRTTSPVTDPARQTYPFRMIVHLPKWAWIWDNEPEGAMSWMKRWPDLIWFGKPPTSLWAMYQWLAIRNPSNNLKFVRGLAVNMLEVKRVKLLYGVSSQVSAKYDLRGAQFFTVTGKYLRYFNFHYVGKYIWIRLGHKVEPRHWDLEGKIKEGEEKKVDATMLVENTEHRKIWKGMTFRFGLMYKLREELSS